MGPVLKEIKKEFDKYKKVCKAERDAGMGVCDMDPFWGNYWMYDYLFPEITMFQKKWDINYPCKHCSEEQVLRIMAEHGLL